MQRMKNPIRPNQLRARGESKPPVLTEGPVPPLELLDDYGGSRKSPAGTEKRGAERSVGEDPRELRRVRESGPGLPRSGDHPL